MNHTALTITINELSEYLDTEIIVETKTNIYEGQLMSLNDSHLTMEYFNGVKDEVREVDIPFTDIIKITD